MCAKLLIIDGEISDYVSPSEQKDSTLTVSLTPAPNNPAFDALLHESLDGKHSNKVNRQQEPRRLLQSPHPPTTSRDQVIMARIHNDLNSPSAALRLRAIRALKSPTKGPYSQFDVSHQERSLISPSERVAPPKPLTIQEVMRDIIVYVEVRSGEDNRSEGVKKVISALGAKINNKLKRDTTHVVFKDGLLSTFRKAKQWNIPVVSILWIEACKKQRKICDPASFPISNIDRYENPELYEKMKRHKSMQPDSECNKRVRAKPVNGGTPKNSTPRATNNLLKKTVMLSSNTPTSASNNKKTEITQYFESQGSKKDDKNDKIPLTPQQPTFISGLKQLHIYTASPATQLLERIHKNCFTPVALNYDIDEEEEKQDSSKSPDDSNRNDSTPKTTKAVTTPRRPKGGREKVCSPKSRQRRHSSEQKNSKTTSSTTPGGTSNGTEHSDDHCAVAMPPGRITRRRSALYMSALSITSLKNDVAISIEEQQPNTPYSSAISTSTEDPKATTTETAQPKNITRRRTSYSAKPLDVSDNKTKGVGVDQVKEQIKHRRRTAYTPRKLQETLEEEEDVPEVAKKVTTHRRRTMYTPQKIDNDTSQRHRTVNSIRKMDETVTENEENIEREHAPKTSQRRRTLYTPRKMEETLVENAPNKATDNMIEQQPTKSTNSRRTLYTASKSLDASEVTQQKSVEDTTSTDTLQHNEGSHAEILKDKSQPMLSIESSLHSVIDCSIPLASSTRLQNETNAQDVLQEEHTPIAFSSTREPGRRRTFFDMSMDIITQRVQNINQSARRSIAPHSVTSEMDIHASSKQYGTPVSSKSDIICKPTTEPNNNDEPIKPMIKKKRKLFMPNNSPDLPPTVAPVNSLGSLIASGTVNAKRRRTLAATPASVKESLPMQATAKASQETAKTQATKSSKEVVTNELPPAPTSQQALQTKESAVSSIAPTVSTASKSSVPRMQKKPSTRRSSFDFVDVKDAKSKTPTIHQRQLSPSAAAVAAADKSRPTSGELPKSDESSKTKKSHGLSNSEHTAEDDTSKGKKKVPFIVYTNMHREQIDIIREALKKLGGFGLEDNVSDRTTHLISLEPRRTMNMLRALCRGLWILEYTWLRDSLRVGHWLSEEPYELRDFTRAVEICRSERQAFGDTYRCELFTNLGAFYISARCGHIPRADLSELIKLCGGHVVEQRKIAKYILGNANRLMEDKVYITPYWILDSITQMQLQKFHRYAFSTEMPKTQQAQTQMHMQPYQMSQQMHSALQRTQDELEQLNF